VPHVALSENNRFLIVERFDLSANGEYLGFEDFCCLNAFSTHEKYQGSYEQLSKRIAQFVAPEQISKSLETFFRSLAVSCAVKNGDAHLKNFGVLYAATDKAVTLAPAYDIVTTAPYRDDAMALTLGGSKRFPDAKKLLAFAKLHCNLQPEKAAQILEHVADAVAMTLPDVQRHIKEFAGFKSVGEGMIAAWNTRPPSAG
jgi:serine/threonine-protein kinase HipA